MTFLLAQISDTHLSQEKPFFVENFETTAEHIRTANYDFVINTGDVSLNGADHPEDLAEAHRRHETIGVPYAVIPGNHDIGDNIEIAHHQPYNADRRARWLEAFKEDFWSLDIPGWRILGLNSQSLGSGLAGDAEQIEFIRAGIADLDGRALALFIHKPLFGNSFAETEVSGHFVNPQPRQSLTDALGSARPRLVACGHIHQYRDHSIDGVRHVWAPATSFFLGRPHQPDYGTRTVGFIEHAFDPDGSFSSTFIGVGKTVMNDLLDFPDAYGDLRKMRAAQAA